MASIPHWLADHIPDIKYSPQLSYLGFYKKFQKSCSKSISQELGSTLFIRRQTEMELDGSYNSELVHHGKDSSQSTLEIIPDSLLHGLALCPLKSLTSHKNIQIGKGPDLSKDPQSGSDSLLLLDLHFETENNSKFLQVHKLARYTVICFNNNSEASFILEC